MHRAPKYIHSRIVFQHKAKHVVLVDDGRQYLGGVGELMILARKLAPTLDWRDENEADWVKVAREQCQVRMATTTITTTTGK